jgi:hypothetical protein
MCMDIHWLYLTCMVRPYEPDIPGISKFMFLCLCSCDSLTNCLYHLLSI